MMGEYFEKWAEKERQWINAEKKRIRKNALVYAGVLTVICPLFSIVIGLMSGVEDFWRGVPASLLVGAVMGFCVWAMICCTNPSKRYEKEIAKCVVEQMTETQREDFARQMLGQDPNSAVREVLWKNLLSGRGRACVTRDYLTLADERGNFYVIHLWKTERIELDAKNYSYRVRTGGMTFRISNEVYPVDFFYKGSTRAASGESDAGYAFEKRKTRDEVIQAIQAVAGNLYDENVVS